MASLKDIARFAGVTVSTVSKALNGSREINKDTTNRIIKIAGELGYKSNKFNNLLNDVPSNIIGVIAPEVISGYYSVIIEEIQRIVQGAGYLMFAAFSNFKSGSEVELLHVFKGKKVDGILIIRSSSEDTTHELESFVKDNKIPVVQIVHSALSGETAANCCDGFTIDDEFGISLAAQHLMEMGHKRIGFVGDEYSMQRLEHFKSFAKRNGLEVDNQLIKVGSERFELGGYMRMKEMLESGRRPTAVVASYDNIAIGAMHAIIEKGLRVPEDISVTGFDDIKSSSYLHKPLTTVAVPISELGKISAEALLKKVKNKDHEIIQHVILKPKLMVRETTAAVHNK